LQVFTANDVIPSELSTNNTVLIQSCGNKLDLENSEYDEVEVEDEHNFKDNNIQEVNLICNFYYIYLQ